MFWDADERRDKDWFLASGVCGGCVGLIEILLEDYLGLLTYLPTLHKRSGVGIWTALVEEQGGNITYIETTWLLNVLFMTSLTVFDDRRP